MFTLCCNWLSRHQQPSLLASNMGRYPRRSSLPVSNKEMFSFYHRNRSVSVFGNHNEEDEFSLSYTNEEVSKSTVTHLDNRCTGSC